MVDEVGSPDDTDAVLLTAPGIADIDQAIVVNGEINIRKTHPNLHRGVLTFGVIEVLLAANFYWLNPTFEVFHVKNWIWATVFLALGVSKLVFLNLYRNLRIVRMVMAFNVSFIIFFGIGTCEPWLDGVGSLQLPILYMGMAVSQLWLLVEPFLNPWTATRAEQSRWVDKER